MAILTSEGLDSLDLEAWEQGSVVTSVEVGGPAPREVMFDRPGRDGNTDLTEMVSARAVTLAVTVANGAQSRRALLDRMAPFMHPARRSTLTLTEDGVQRSLQVRADPVSLPWSRPSHMDLTWSFRTVGSPYFTGQARTLDLQPSLPAPGAPFDWDFDVAFPEAPVTTAVAFQAGNEAAEWTATIHGPCRSPRIRNEVTGDAVVLTGLVLTEGQTAVVTSGDRKVHVDGLVRYSAVDNRRTRWWLIPPGSTAVRAPMAGASGDARVVLAYSDTYFA